MTKIKIDNNRPKINFFVKNTDEVYQSQQFLVDTGFTGNIVFVIKDSLILKKIKFYNLEELPNDKSIVVADGRRVKTFLGIMSIIIDKEAENVQALIIEGKEDSDPIIGIDFLRQNKKRLNLDFGNEVFELV